MSWAEMARTGPTPAKRTGSLASLSSLFLRELLSLCVAAPIDVVF